MGASRYGTWRHHHKQTHSEALKSTLARYSHHALTDIACSHTDCSACTSIHDTVSDSTHASWLLPDWWHHQNSTLLCPLVTVTVVHTCTTARSCNCQASRFMHICLAVPCTCTCRTSTCTQGCQSSGITYAKASTHMHRCTL